MSTKQKITIKQAGGILIGLLLIMLVFGAGMAYGPDIDDNGGYEPVLSDGKPLPSGNKAAPSVGGGTLPNILHIRPTDVPRGSGRILLIEYSDYECPFCERFHSTVQTLVDSGEVQWVYRHLPLPFHETAEEGAVIAECVRIHKGGNAFWKYTDDVFAASEKSLATYQRLAQGAGLSDGQVKRCLESGSEAYATVKQHLEDAQLFGINGTPGSFLVNTETGVFKRVPGAVPLEGAEGGVSLRGLLREVQ